MNDNHYKSETITFCAACFSVAAVVATLIVSIYFGTKHNNQAYYSVMQQCIEARGTWVPSVSSGACIIADAGLVH